MTMPDKCQYCGHPVLQPVVSNYCINCGKLTGVWRADEYDPSYVPKDNEVLFEAGSLFLGNSYQFLPYKFRILKRSKVLEEIQYSEMEDCEARYISYNETLSGGYVPYYLKITITLRNNAHRQIELTGNPINEKLGLDLATWLNVKLAENESKSI